MSISPGSSWLTIEQIAWSFNCSPSTVRRWVREHRVTASHGHGATLIDEQSVMTARATMRANQHATRFRPRITAGHTACATLPSEW